MSGVTAKLAGPVAALVLCVAPLGAQQSPARAGASLEAGMRASKLRGAVEALWGGAGLIQVHPRVSVGGGGWVLVGRTEIAGTGPGSDLELSFGYGGVVADVLLWGSSRSRLSFRVLAGAGNAEVLVPVVGSEIGADNFGLVEPELVAARWLTGVLSVRASASYRFAYAVEDLPQVAASDLRGMSFSVAVGIGRP